MKLIELILHGFGARLLTVLPLFYPMRLALPESQSSIAMGDNFFLNHPLCYYVVGLSTPNRGRSLMAHLLQDGNLFRSVNPVTFRTFLILLAFVDITISLFTVFPVLSLTYASTICSEFGVLSHDAGRASDDLSPAFREGFGVFLQSQC